jgi:hypothetical protein|tara:strand:+ start:1648 stop:1866 length:219 start_codon:yes stop_codon:yes gene_type:complete
MIKKTMIEQQSALDEVDEFIEQYVGDPLLLSAALIVAAKKIYQDNLGVKETKTMLELFANDAEVSYARVTVH